MFRRLRPPSSRSSMRLGSYSRRSGWRSRGPARSCHPARTRKFPVSGHWNRHTTRSGNFSARSTAWKRGSLRSGSSSASAFRRMKPHREKRCTVSSQLEGLVAICPLRDDLGVLEREGVAERHSGQNQSICGMPSRLRYAAKRGSPEIESNSQSLRLHTTPGSLLSALSRYSKARSLSPRKA